MDGEDAPLVTEAVVIDNATDRRTNVPIASFSRKFVVDAIMIYFGDGFSFMQMMENGANFVL